MRYIAQMARLCRRYVKSEADIPEVLTEGFLNVFNQLSKFEYRGTASLKVWIRKIMINQALMHLRKQRSLLWVDMETAQHHHEAGLEASFSVAAAMAAEEIEEKK